MRRRPSSGTTAGEVTRQLDDTAYDNVVVVKDSIVDVVKVANAITSINGIASTVVPNITEILMADTYAAQAAASALSVHTLNVTAQSGVASNAVYNPLTNTINFTLVEGVQGTQGPQGPAGNGIQLNGSDTVANILLLTRPANEFWIATDTGNGYLSTGTGWVNVGPVQGPQGIQGPAGTAGTIGTDGKSVYQVALDNGFIGTEAAFLLTLKGDTGAQGPQGVEGPQGLQGSTGDIGPSGNSILSGPVNPTTEGINNDMYFNTTTSDLFKKIVGIWTLQGSLKGLKGDTGSTGVAGVSITNVVRTAGTGAAGTVDIYTIYYSNSTTSTFQVYNGADGVGVGDMTKSVYDTNNNGVVDNAALVNGLTVDTAVPVGAVFTDTVYTHPTNHPASIITQDIDNRFVSDTEKSLWNSKASTATATIIANGLMSAIDKDKLDHIDIGANNYILPTSVVHDTESGALHATDALRVSGTTLSLYKGDNSFESVTTQDTVYTHPTYTFSTTTADTTTTLTNIPLLTTLTQTNGHVTGGTHRKLVAGTNVTLTPASDGNITISANDTSISWNELTSVPTTFTPTTHNQAESTITFSDITTGNVSTTAHGYAPKLSNITTQYLNGTGTYTTPPDTVYTHPTGDGNLHVPATGTVNNGKVLTAGATAGSISWVAPTVGTVTSVTGVAPISVDTGTTTPSISMAAATAIANGYMTSAYASKLDGIAAGAQVNVATNLTSTAGTTTGPTIDSSTGTGIVIPSASATASGVVTTGAQTFAGVKTFAAASTEFLTTTSTQDGIILLPRVGGTASLRGTITPEALTASRTYTLPDLTGTFAMTSQLTSGTVTSVTASGSLASSGGTTPAISHLTTDGNLHVPATGTINSGKVLTAGATAGSITWETPAIVSSTLDGLTDVTITTPTSGQVVSYNGTVWVNSAPPSAGVLPIDETISHLSTTAATVNTDGTLATMTYTGGYKTLYTYTTGNLTKVEYTDTNGITILLTETISYTVDGIPLTTRS